VRGRGVQADGQESITRETAHVGASRHIVHYLRCICAGITGIGTTARSLSLVRAELAPRFKLGMGWRIRELAGQETRSLSVDLTESRLRPPVTLEVS
jgi:hypothetical protein